jgi:hypothetical protein
VKDNVFRMPASMVLMRGVLHGAGRKADCELLLRKELLPGPVQGAVQYRYTQWTVLHAPSDLPDGEYTIATADGFHFPATRARGLWLHREPQPADSRESA